MKARGTLLTVIAIVAILVGALLFYNRAEAPSDGVSSPHGAAAKANLIVATTPTAGAVVSSPLTVSGTARGMWYFEASFPVKLVTDSGTMLAVSPAQAQGEWMTEDFVPFTITLSFPPQPAGSTGKLILSKDNPSGDPMLDDYLEIPVTF